MNKQAKQTEVEREAALFAIESRQDMFERYFDDALENLAGIDRTAYMAAIGSHLDTAIQAVRDAQDKLIELIDGE